jgi:hypothetical protein
MTTDEQKPAIPATMTVPNGEPKVFTEVKVRQFFRALDGGAEAIPATVFYVEGTEIPADLAALVAQMTDAIKTNLGGSVRPMSLEEVRSFVMTEITAHSIAAAQAKGSLMAINAAGPQPLAGADGGDA